MTATIVFATQVALSFVSFGLVARWLVYPRLRGRSLSEALTPLLLFHTFRTVGLIFLVPTLVDAALPAAFTIPDALGDMLAVTLAFVSLIAVRSEWRGARALVWLFSLVGIADFVNVFARGLWFDIAGHYSLGIAWLIPTYGVPVFFTVHLMIIALLLRRGTQPDPTSVADQWERGVDARAAVSAGVGE